MPSQACNASAREAGFTLVEAVVGLALLALSLAGMQQVLSSGWAGMRHANMETAALSLARARLAAAGSETPLLLGESSGETAAGLRWSLAIEAHQSQTGLNAPAVLVGYWVKSTVTWRDEPTRAQRTVSVTTLKLGPPQ
jgi:type II secretory pathway pseudopilin PulG